MLPVDTMMTAITTLKMIILGVIAIFDQLQVASFLVKTRLHRFIVQTASKEREEEKYGGGRRVLLLILPDADQNNRRLNQGLQVGEKLHDHMIGN